MDLIPRNYKPGGDVLEHTYAVMLAKHPESFDVMVYPALDSTKNEIISVNAPEITLLDRDERLQAFGEPFQARARIVPEESLSFEVVDSAQYEAFHGASEAIHLMLSVPNVRTFSVIQWLEYLDRSNTETVIRTVYVAATRNIGRTTLAQFLHICLPLPVKLTLPEAPADTEQEESPAAPAEQTEVGEF